MSDLADFGNALNSCKLALSYASSFYVVHQEKSEILDELPQGMSSEPIEVKPILSPSIPISDMSFEPISKPILDLDDPKCALPSESYDDLVIDFGDSLRHSRHGIHQDPKSNQEEQQQ